MENIYEGIREWIYGLDNAEEFFRKGGRSNYLVGINAK
jgi:hypothetical protein